MADSIGLSFMPGQQDPNGNPNGQRPSPVQQAIQTLALRIPRTVGAASGAPQALLTSPGGSMLGGNPNSAAILEQLRRWLFGGGTASGQFSPRPQLPSPGPLPQPPIPGLMHGAPSGPGVPWPNDPRPTPAPSGPDPEPAPPQTFPKPGVHFINAPPEEPLSGLGPSFFERGPRNREV